MDKKSAITLALKIRALVIHGSTLGERNAASTKLKEHMLKYDITDSDLDETALDWFLFSRKKDEHILFVQCVCKALNKSSYEVKKSKKFPSKLYIKCSEYEAMMIKYLYSVYSKSFRKSLVDYQLAFCIANDLMSERSSDADFTKEDIERQRQAARMSLNIKKTLVNRPISQ